MRLIVVFILISNVANADCLRTVDIRIDDSYSKREIEIIKRALDDWKVASNNRICFTTYTDTIDFIEMFTHNYDGILTIYNNDLWQVITAVVKHKCYNECVGVTTKDELFDAPDIFVVVKYHFSHLITHEIGHLLGLGHSKDPKNIMFEYVRASNKISNKDKKVLDCIIRNKEVLSWKPKCKYEGEKNVVHRKRKNEVGYIESKRGF